MSEARAARPHDEGDRTRGTGSTHRETGAEEPGAAAPPLEGVHEAALYTTDLEAAARFYASLGLTEIGRAAGRHVFFRVGKDLLLIFDPRGTERGGAVPGHGARGQGHVALSVPHAEALEAWRARLADADIDVESEIEWPSGGRSIYFRDPAGNSIELITRGSWGF